MAKKYPDSVINRFTELYDTGMSPADILATIFKEFKVEYKYKRLYQSAQMRASRRAPRLSTVKNRSCLRCKNLFQSQGAHNRICSGCSGVEGVHMSEHAVMLNG